MATNEELSAEKAFSQAVEISQQPEAKPSPTPAAAPALPETAQAEPAPKPKPVSVAKKNTAPAKKASKTASAKPKKAAARKTAKATPKKVAITAKAPAKRKAAAKTKQKSVKSMPSKETKIMSNAKKTAKPSFDVKATIDQAQKKSKEAVADVQKFGKDAYKKGSKFLDEGSAIAKANAEAVVESGKIVATGVKDLAKTNVKSTRTVVGTVGEDLKALAEIKSPAALFEMQGKLAARNYEAVTAAASKNRAMIEDMVKSAFAPISDRTKATYEAVRKAA